jgi:hypothetical protein
MWILSGRGFAVTQLIRINQCGLGLLAVGAVSLWAVPVMAQDAMASEPAIADEAAIDRPTDNFWPDAQKILESQANWFDRAEAAVMTPEPLVNQILSTKLLMQLRSMDLFVQRYDRNPARLCQSGQAATGLDAQQMETYCAIVKLSREMMPLRERLTQRSSLFNTSRPAPKTPLFTLAPPVGTASFSTSGKPTKLAPFYNKPIFAKSVEQVNLTSRIAAAPTSQVFVYPQMVGVQRLKQWQANYRPQVAPAIAPPLDLINLINQGRSQLVTVQAALPIQSQGLSTPVQVFKPAAPMVSSKFAVRSTEADIYQTFLAQPNTGIGRVYAAQSFVSDVNRLNPANVPTPFGLRIEDGQFLLGGDALNYGFVTDIGDVPVADVRANVELPELFQAYAPPNTLAAIENHQRRFLVGKDTPLTSSIPAQLHRTYVMRLVQYQLPEIVATGRPLASGDRGQLKTLLQHQGTDRLIAFQPVIQRNDGSYTILWKVLDTKAAPQIVDLDQYISTNLKTRSRN